MGARFGFCLLQFLVFAYFFVTTCDSSSSREYSSRFTRSSGGTFSKPSITTALKAMMKAAGGGKSGGIEPHSISTGTLTVTKASVERLKNVSDYKYTILTAIQEH